MRSLLCAAGIHRWRHCMEASWDMEHVRTALQLRACTRCRRLHEEDVEHIASIDLLAGLNARIYPIAEAAT